MYVVVNAVFSVTAYYGHWSVARLPVTVQPLPIQVYKMSNTLKLERTERSCGLWHSLNMCGLFQNNFKNDKVLQIRKVNRVFIWLLAGWYRRQGSVHGAGLGSGMSQSLDVLSHSHTFSCTCHHVVTMVMNVDGWIILTLIKVSFHTTAIFVFSPSKVCVRRRGREGRGVIGGLVPCPYMNVIVRQSNNAQHIHCCHGCLY